MSTVEAKVTLSVASEESCTKNGYFCFWHEANYQGPCGYYDPDEDGCYQFSESVRSAKNYTSYRIWVFSNKNCEFGSWTLFHSIEPRDENPDFKWDAWTFKREIPPQE
jgi:hypothetical protein